MAKPPHAGKPPKIEKPERDEDVWSIRVLDADDIVQQDSLNEEGWSAVGVVDIGGAATVVMRKRFVATEDVEVEDTRGVYGRVLDEDDESE